MATLALALIVCLGIAVYILRKHSVASKLEAHSLRTRVQSIEQKYGALIDLDGHKTLLMIEKNEIQLEVSALRKQYAEKKVIFDELVKEAAIYDNEIEIAEWGLYKPHFEFDTSERFKLALEENRRKQKILLDTELARMKAGGRTSRDMKLPDYAFNRACDAVMSNVRWNNAVKMEQRIGKAFKFINKNADQIHITQDVLDLKLEELHLTHEYALKKKAERDEQAAIRQQMREDAKLEDDLNNASAEEDRYRKLLEKAKKEAESASGSREKELEAKVTMLAQELLEAQQKTERAKSLAEQTKRGHVYVISNRGSFGDSIFKIGMTRRLDPLDRVDELGGASVPFIFDVHAIIYTEDAPALEKALHRELADRRMNLVNYRKEFFCVELRTIQDLVAKTHKDAEFVITPEAREYTETLALRAAADKKRTDGDARIKFPIAI